MDVVVYFGIGLLALVGLGIWLYRISHSRSQRGSEKDRVVHLTTHARERMNQRGVSEAELNYVLRAPGRVTADAANGSVRLEREVPGGSVKVWVVAPWSANSDDEVVVKTTARSFTCSVSLPAGAAGRVIGKQGTVVKALQESTGAKIRVDRAAGIVRVCADTGARRDAAERAIQELLA